MRLRILHTTTYRYEPQATSVIQILRMTPGSHDGQYVAEWQIDVSTDTKLDTHEDAFGNVTHVLSCGPVGDIKITAEGLIETHDTPAAFCAAPTSAFRPACSCGPPTLPRSIPR
ncbi:transglutaminase-like putative cysteine protease [Bradyrhizobium sp. GM6.1]